jgi:hypothetical protein
VGFIETKGRFYLAPSLNSVTGLINLAAAHPKDEQNGHTKDDSSGGEVRIVNGFRLIQKLDGEILEVIRSIFHIPTKVKFNSQYNFYILDTTNSRGIKNIVKYLQGTMKGMKALSFRL